MGFELIAEEKIREALENGAFDNLSGAGKPLRAADDDFAGDNWMAFNVLRSNGFLPEWLELRKQIAHERDAVHAAFKAWESQVVSDGLLGSTPARNCGETYRRLATAINAKIDLHNLRCPSFQLEIARFREDATPPGYLTGGRSSES